MQTVAEQVRIFADQHDIPYDFGDEVQVIGGEPDDPSYVITPYNIRLDSREVADKSIGYPLVIGCQNFGMTGWDWLNRRTKWVLVADFDVADDGKKTPRTVTVEEMDRIIALLSRIPWLTLKRSKGGRGVHAFARFSEPLPADDRGAHQRIANSVREFVEQTIGEPLPADKTGSVAYVWTRHPKPDAFAIINEATETLANFAAPQAVDHNDEFAAVELTQRHRTDLAILAKSPCPPQHVPDRGCYRVHTCTLKAIDPMFVTVSAGTDPQHPNAFLFPRADGSWRCCRYSGAKEHSSWHHEGDKTWTILNPVAFDFSWADTGDDFAPVDVETLRERHPKLNEPLVDGLCRKGETMSVIASAKTGKSWLSYSLALSIAAGRRWLDTFECRRGDVLIIDNELHPSLLANRIPFVADALGIKERSRIQVTSLRGRLLDLDGIGQRIVSKIEHGRYAAVIVDAWYRALPGGSAGENDNAAMAKAFNMVDGFAARTGATWVLIHHSSKGDQSGKAVTDVGAGAGAQSRAADTHVVLRPHEEPDHLVLDAVVRSFRPINPLVLRWDFPVFKVADGLDPASLQQPKRARQQTEDASGRAKIMGALSEGPASAKELVAKAGMGHQRITRLLGQLVTTKDVEFETEVRRGNECHIYRSTSC